MSQIAKVFKEFPIFVVTMSKSGINRRFTLVFTRLEQEGKIISRERGKVAEDLGLHPSRLSEILSGKRNLATDELANFVMKFRVNPFYILFETMPVFFG